MAAIIKGCHTVEIVQRADSINSGDEEIFDRVMQAITVQGYIILDQFFTASMLQALCTNYHSIDHTEFKPAGVGREQDFQLNQQVRRDEIFWLDGCDDATTGYFLWMEQLRRHLNRELFLGLFDYEAHYANFPKGAFYKRHVDAFQGSSNRRLSTVLYLNEHWQVPDHGELLMYRQEEVIPFETIQPLYGRMVIFLSERFPHEVAVTNKARFSLTGWFRINANTADYLDPPN
ncbi:MAG: 2OG-Fe(II) oxygenase [Gammaproteobacteria bacterium]|nr:2OG-Fe(II) oxygenase [Gammaproteobacteria bacterium]